MNVVFFFSCRTVIIFEKRLKKILTTIIPDRKNSMQCFFPPSFSKIWCSTAQGRCRHLLQQDAKLLQGAADPLRQRGAAAGAPDGPALPLHWLPQHLPAHIQDLYHRCRRHRQVGRHLQEALHLHTCQVHIYWFLEMEHIWKMLTWPASSVECCLIVFSQEIHPASHFISFHLLFLHMSPLRLCITHVCRSPATSITTTTTLMLLKPGLSSTHTTASPSCHFVLTTAWRSRSSHWTSLSKYQQEVQQLDWGNLSLVYIKASVVHLRLCSRLRPLMSVLIPGVVPHSWYSTIF